MVKKEIANNVEKRLSGLSCNEKVFNQEKVMYEMELKKRGYRSELKYIPKEDQAKKKKVRSRQAIYFTPPYSVHVKTNIGKEFLKLLDKCFHKDHIFKKTFNRHTVKLSYSTMPNIKKRIDKHNAKVMNKKSNNKDEKKCNCKIPKKNTENKECPIGPLDKDKRGQCLVKSVVYQADVHIIDGKGEKIKDKDGKELPPKIYYGLTERTFKDRYTEHKQAFKNRNSDKATALSNYIWDMKDQGLETKVKWSVKTKGFVFSSGSKQCDLCLSEKHAILFTKDPKQLINKRHELLNGCMHKSKYLLESCKPEDYIPP